MFHDFSILFVNEAIFKYTEQFTFDYYWSSVAGVLTSTFSFSSTTTFFFLVFHPPPPLLAPLLFFFLKVRLCHINKKTCGRFAFTNKFQIAKQTCDGLYLLCKARESKRTNNLMAWEVSVWRWSLGSLDHGCHSLPVFLSSFARLDLKLLTFRPNSMNTVHDNNCI